MDVPLQNNTTPTVTSSPNDNGEILSLQESSLLQFTKEMDLGSILQFCNSSEKYLNIATNGVNFWRHTFARLFGVWSTLQRTDLTTGQEWYEHASRVADGLVYKMTLHSRNALFGGNTVTSAYSTPFIDNWGYQIPFEIKGLRLKPGKIFVARVTTIMYDLVSTDNDSDDIIYSGRILDDETEPNYKSEFFTDKDHAVVWVSTEVIKRLTSRNNEEDSIGSYKYAFLDRSVLLDKQIPINSEENEIILMKYIKTQFAADHTFLMCFITNHNKWTRELVTCPLDYPLALRLDIEVTIEESDFK